MTARNQVNNSRTTSDWRGSLLTHSLTHSLTHWPGWCLGTAGGPLWCKWDRVPQHSDTCIRADHWQGVFPKLAPAGLPHTSSLARQLNEKKGEMGFKRKVSSCHYWLSVPQNPLGTKHNIESAGTGERFAESSSSITMQGIGPGAGSRTLNVALRFPLSAAHQRATLGCMNRKIFGKRGPEEWISHRAFWMVKEQTTRKKYSVIQKPALLFADMHLCFKLF